MSTLSPGDLLGVKGLAMVALFLACLAWSLVLFVPRIATGAAYGSSLMVIATCAAAFVEASWDR
jgi:hypothetical protein